MKLWKKLLFPPAGPWPDPSQKKFRSHPGPKGVLGFPLDLDSRWVVVPQNGWFIMEIPIKMDDFGGTPIFRNTQVSKNRCCKVIWLSILLSKPPLLQAVSLETPGEVGGQV